ncbi:MAG TPA: hypothetical protein VN829_15845 [Dongiaceae bacterium]|nr:hypothetical protein [Dongiaceae bacterium]
MNDQNKPCYETAEQNLFTRFETEKHGHYALPYVGLLYAHQSPPGNAPDTLTLFYVTHTVTIRGAQLASLLMVIQKGRAETIRVGGGQGSGATSGPSVREIRVVEGGHQQESAL